LSHEHQPTLSTARDEQGIPAGIHQFQHRAEMVTDPRGACMSPSVGHPGLQTVWMVAVRADPGPEVGPWMGPAQPLFEVTRPDQDYALALTSGDLERNALGCDVLEQLNPYGPRPSCADSRENENPWSWLIHASTSSARTSASANRFAPTITPTRVHSCLDRPPFSILWPRFGKPPDWDEFNWRSGWK
jgi:hypothetical protein